MNATNMSDFNLTSLDAKLLVYSHVNANERFLNLNLLGDSFTFYFKNYTDNMIYDNNNFRKI